MKKFVLVFSSILMFSTNAVGADIPSDKLLLKIQQETERYKKNCYEKEAFPGDFDNYSMYNDDIKNGDIRYHQCLKKVIIQKIKKITAPDEAAKMINNLDKIQKEFSEFYWTLFNHQDNGIIGKGANDALLGRRFEDILEDIIYYQVIYGSD